MVKFIIIFIFYFFFVNSATNFNFKSNTKAQETCQFNENQ